MSDAGERSAVSFLVSVARLPGKGLPVAIEADADQRRALSEDHGLVEVERFAAEMLVTRWKRDGVRVTGRVTADFIQSCIVTLEPLKQHVDETFEAILVPEGSPLAVPERLVEGEILIDAEGPDAPEIYQGDTIDAGQLAEEYFELAIDPYPRKSGARLPEPRQEGDDGAVEDRGPLFDKLAALKDRLDKS